MRGADVAGWAVGVNRSEVPRFGFMVSIHTLVLIITIIKIHKEGVSRRGGG